MGQFAARKRELGDETHEAFERRNAAIHEAGHAVIARHVGVHVEWAEIWRKDPADEGEKAWIGRCRFYRPRPVSRARRAMIAVAGAIAEHVWRGEADFLRNEGEWAWDEEAIMSPTDWDLTGCAPGEPDAVLMRAVDKALVPAER
jgi:hypothetical protein